MTRLVAQARNNTYICRRGLLHLICGRGCAKAPIPMVDHPGEYGLRARQSLELISVGCTIWGDKNTMLPWNSFQMLFLQHKERAIQFCKVRCYKGSWTKLISNTTVQTKGLFFSHNSILLSIFMSLTNYNASTASCILYDEQVQFNHISQNISNFCSILIWKTPKDKIRSFT